MEKRREEKRERAIEGERERGRDRKWKEGEKEKGRTERVDGISSFHHPAFR